jgi:hypothetical protein
MKQFGNRLTSDTLITNLKRWLTKFQIIWINRLAVRSIVFIIILFSVEGFSQDLIGNWKVISYEDEVVYYNKIIDSLTYKDISKGDRAESFRANAELLIFPITYRFESNGQFTLNHPILGVIKEQYTVDSLRKKITFIDSDQKRDEHSYHFDNEYFFIEMKMQTGFIELGLHKFYP